MRGRYEIFSLRWTIPSKNPLEVKVNIELMRSTRVGINCGMDFSLNELPYRMRKQFIAKTLRLYGNHILPDEKLKCDHDNHLLITYFAIANKTYLTEE